MNKLLSNITHVPSSLAGGALAGLGALLALLNPNTPIGGIVQEVAAAHPKVAAGLAVVAGLGLIFGVGPKEDNSK